MTETLKPTTSPTGDTTKRICDGCGVDQTPLQRGITAATYTNGQCAGLFCVDCFPGINALILLDANGRPGAIFLNNPRYVKAQQDAKAYQEKGGTWKPSRIWPKIL